MPALTEERWKKLLKARHLLNKLPREELFELPGRPGVVYQLRSYAGLEDGVAQARLDVPFLFKAFERGQLNPQRLAKLHGGQARASTIHEYLDWTAMAREPASEGELDFSGFHFIFLYARYRSQWPPPYTPALDGVKAHPRLGPPLDPAPKLMPVGKAVCAATIRSGIGYLEVPFFATKETQRGKGYARALLEAIEDVARACDLDLMLLCSSEEKHIVDLWTHLGFSLTKDEDLDSFGVAHSELLHMQNTCQMHKRVPPPKRFKAVMIKHGHFRQRVYAMWPPRQADDTEPKDQQQISKATKTQTSSLA